MFRRSIANIANGRSPDNDGDDDRSRRQTDDVEVTADNVRIVAPSPIVDNDGNLVVVFFIETDDGQVFSGTQLTKAVQETGDTLASEVCEFVLLYHICAWVTKGP